MSTHGIVVLRMLVRPRALDFRRLQHLLLAFLAQ